MTQPPLKRPFDVQALYSTYLAACNEANADAREELLSRCCTDDTVVIYPSGHFAGPAAIAGFLGGLQARFAGVRFHQLSGIEERDEWFRVAWRMTVPSGSVLMDGEDVVERDPDGQLKRVVGFHNPLPDLPA